MGVAVELAGRLPSAWWKRLLLLLGVVVVVALVVGVVVVLTHGDQAKESAASAAPAPATTAPSPTPPPPPPAGDALHPGIDISPTGLAPELDRRVKLAIAAAKKKGIRLKVNSGWRTPAKQQQLYKEAIKEYGSVALARRWVLPAGESEHPRGRAVDMGPPAAAKWLQNNGATFGLCRRYDTEPWHFEPMTPPGGRCPPRQPDANTPVRTGSASPSARVPSETPRVPGG